MPSAVFCYAPPDVGIARDLGAYLELNCPVEVYYDEGRVRFGFDLVAAAERAVAADWALVLLSPESVPQQWKRERWEPVFFESGNHIACLLLRECNFPQLLRRRTFFDFSEDPIGARRALKRWVLARYRAPVTALDLPPGHTLPEEVMKRLRRHLADQPGSECLDRESAVSFAHSCAQDFEGVFWIRCTHRGVTGILGETGQALGLRLTGPPEENRRALRDFCAGHRCLYIFEGIAEEHWEAADLGGKASVIITLPDEAARPRRPEELRSLFSAWIRNEEACLRALGEVEWHLRGGSWQEVQELGVAAVALLKHRERMAEAHEFLELLANSAQAAGDPARLGNCAGTRRGFWSSGVNRSRGERGKCQAGKRRNCRSISPPAERRVSECWFMAEPVILVANGDLRLSANQKCWPAQERAEAAVMGAIERQGRQVKRGHPYDPQKQHGFIDSQKYGMEVFRQIPRDAPLVVVEAVWQYSHHLLHGLYSHQGPILTVANWSGEWPGLVGMLNLNGSLTKAGVKYDTLWSVDFSDDFFLENLRRWLNGQPLVHDTSHVHALAGLKLPGDAEELGAGIAGEMQQNKAILGIFDEGCMGMYNAIIPDELLHRTGVFKERLSQSALYAEMCQTSDGEARAVRRWLDERGLQFKTGPNPESDLTEEQILAQCKMYIAALRIADDFGCDAIGIQYQQGLKDLAPASDLAEGLLNNTERPPVSARNNGRELYAGRPLPHFNEVDECAGLDALVTNRVWTKLGYDPETTLHDVRYGEEYNGEFVWVFEISGAAPPKHFINGYRGASSERQPPMYFRLGGGTLKGISKPGEIVWSRIYVDNGALKADIGRAAVRQLPREETERRWRITTPQWPIMHAVTYGITRDQMMARHKANHVQVAYTPDAAAANRALAAKAAAFRALGLDVCVCGTNNGLVQ